MPIKPRLIAALLPALLALPSLATQLSPGTPLVVDGDVRVDVGDVEGFIQRIPPERRGEAKAAADRIGAYADAIFVARSFAAKARAAGLDKDPIVQRRLEQAQDSLLADLYLQHLQQSALKPDLEKRARELYIADPARFTTPEQVHVQHVLINFQGRTREMAKELAQKVYEDAKSGREDFLTLAARHSDDTEKLSNGGDMRYVSPAGLVEPVRKQIASMSRKGEVAPPVESHQGFHIIRFIDRRAPQLAKFEDVKRGIIAAEREALQKKQREEAIAAVRGSSTVVVHRANVEAMVVPIDDVLRKAAAGEKAAESAPKK